MSEKRNGKNGAAEKESVAPRSKIERIGIFMKSWKIVKSYGHSSMNTHITSFRAGQLVFDEDEMLSLLAQGAPIRVYVHDVEFTASGTD